MPTFLDDYSFPAKLAVQLFLTFSSSYPADGLCKLKLLFSPPASQRRLILACCLVAEGSLCLRESV
jgi:hypothetical protein